MTRSPHRSFPRLVLIAVVGALLLAGCGDSGGDKGAYEEGLRTVQGHLDDANKASVEASGELDTQKRTAAIRDQGAALTEAADAAAKLDPPEEVVAPTKKFQKALRAYAKLFDDLIAANGDSAKEAELLGDAGPIVDDLTAANKAIDKAGFKATGSASDS